MAEDSPRPDPEEEGKRIAADYLSKLGWVRQWRMTLTREARPAWTREEYEQKMRNADLMEEEAEAFFSSEYDRLRKDGSPEARETLRAVYKVLGHRNDLGFIGARIIQRIKQQFML